jgi:serine/threonine-protein kinase HipA
MRLGECRSRYPTKGSSKIQVTFKAWEVHVTQPRWSYPDRRTPALAPAYDFLSTIPYIPDEYAAIKYARTKRMSEFSLDELDYLAKARLPEKLVRDIAVETAVRFRDLWTAEKVHLPLVKSVMLSFPPLARASLS